MKHFQYVCNKVIYTNFYMSEVKSLTQLLVPPVESLNYGYKSYKMISWTYVLKKLKNILKLTLVMYLSEGNSQVFISNVFPLFQRF